jgi:3-oxoacyl-[acyl-carrier-protein] synthase II
VNAPLAITAADLTCSVGDGLEACFEALCAGQTGNRALRGFSRSHFRIAHGYEIDDRQDSGDVPGRATAWLTRCIERAARQAGVDLSRDRLPILIGSGLRELRGAELWWRGEASVTAADLHFGGAARRVTGAKGAVLTIANACSASNFALGLGADLLALGEADAVVVAGADSITASMLGMLDRVSAEPPRAVRPFERTRTGVLLGEGAAAVILERADRPRARGVRPLAYLRGVGMSCDAFHETAPSPEGITASMRDAHHRAGVTPEAIGLLMAHGTGTALSDPVEAAAVRSLFGAAASRVVVTAVKSMIGHTSGASGLMSVIVAAESMRRGFVPPTLGLCDRIDEASGLDIVTGEARPHRAALAQVNAFGFGGVNAVAIVERADS